MFAAAILAGAAVQLRATTVEFDFTSGYDNTEYVIEDIIKEGVTIKMSSNGSDKGPQWYSQGTGVRLYGGNIIKVSANENIRSVTFTFSEEKFHFGSGTSAPKVTPGSYSQEGATGIWLVGASTGTLRVGGVDAHARVQKITVETGTGEISGTPDISSENPEQVYVDGKTIVAPEGAAVYDLNGRPADPKNPARGLYIVRLSDGKAVKVLVK